VERREGKTVIYEFERKRFTTTFKCYLESIIEDTKKPNENKILDDLGYP